MQELPLVTIIIPTYNRKQKLIEAIKSALSQKYANLEIVVSDDCSNDGTIEVIKNFLGNPKIKYYRNAKNLKFAGNHRKAILDYAQGQYCIILSDDDKFLDNNYILSAVNFIKKHENISFVGSNYEENNNSNNDKKLIISKLHEITNGIDFLLKRLNSKVGGIFIGTAVFDRNKALKVNPFNVEAPFVDGEFIDKLALTGSVGYIKTTSISYNIHDNNWSRNNGINVNERIKEFDCADRVVKFANEIGIFNKKISEYRNTYYKLVALKIYKEVLYRKPFNLKLFLMSKKIIKEKSGKDYLFLLIIVAFKKFLFKK